MKLKKKQLRNGEEESKREKKHWLKRKSLQIQYDSRRKKIVIVSSHEVSMYLNQLERDKTTMKEEKRFWDQRDILGVPIHLQD